MIVSFAIDTDALPDSPDLAIERRVAHYRLLELWTALGVLLHDGERLTESRILKAIGQLPQSLRTRWQYALKHNRHAPLRTPSCLVSTATSLDDLSPLAGLVEVACLEETRALCLGLPTDCECMTVKNGGIEICRLDMIDQTNSFKRARHLASADIEKDTKVSDLWRERFKAPLKFCKRAVVVVDRYAIESHISRDDGYSGLRKLLTEVAAAGQNRSLAVYSSIQQGRSVQTIHQSLAPLMSSLRNAGIKELTLHLGNTADFGRIAHYRYIRFDDVICELDVGLEALAGESLYRTCTFKMKQRSAATDDAESDLRSVCLESKIS